MRKIIALIMSFIFTVSMVNAVYAENTAKESEPSATPELYYKILPETTEWAKIKDHTEKIAVSQISQDILSSINTKELVLAVLEYPLLIDMYAYESFSDGFETVLANFNGLSELVERHDSASEILNIYRKMQIVKATEFGKNLQDVSNITSDKNRKLYKRMVKLNTLEAFLAQETFFSKLSDSEYRVLRDEVQKKNNEKLEENLIYSSVTNTFIEEINKNSIDARIIKTSSSYNGYLQFGGNYYGYYNATVKTPNNSNVSVFDVRQDFTNAEKSAYQYQVQLAYPNVTFLRDATTTYNCHSYAWYSTSGQYWMNDPSRYWTDMSYTPCVNQSLVGAKIIYRKTTGALTHSGIVNQEFFGPSQPNYNWVDLIMVTSKWGALGLYTHGGGDCPYWNGDGGINTNRAYYYK